MRTLGWMLAVLAAVGCGGSSDDDGSAAPGPAQCSAATATAATTIRLSGMAFVPACARVPVGAQVTFVNDDTVAHTVTADPGQPETFDSGTIPPGGSFTHTFGAALTERVHCTLHPEMRATVIAVEGG